MNKRSFNAGTGDEDRKLCYTNAMDFLALGFYACVCGLLSIFAPQLGTLYVRLAVGAAVGAVSAFVLPLLRSMMGGY